MKILFVGDIVGSPGRDTLKEYLPKLKKNISRTLLLSTEKMLLTGKV